MRTYRDIRLHLAEVSMLEAIPIPFDVNVDKADRD